MVPIPSPVSGEGGKMLPDPERATPQCIVTHSDASGIFSQSQLPGIIRRVTHRESMNRRGAAFVNEKCLV